MNAIEIVGNTFKLIIIISSGGFVKQNKSGLEVLDQSLKTKWNVSVVNVFCTVRIPIS